MKKVLRGGVNLRSEEIIKERITVTTCPRCGCIFTSLYSDREYISGGVKNKIVCPNETCNKLITIES